MIWDGQPVRWYYAITDDLGVLCVDQLSDHKEWTPEDVGSTAASFPDAIYFAVSAGPPPNGLA